MKLVNSTGALLLIAASAPATAQYGAPASPQQRSSPPVQAEAPATAAPAAPALKISAKAAKALRELKDAVDANDTANIPAKLAAAQAAATTNDDRYVVGQLQLKAAYAAKNTTGMLAGIEAIAASGRSAPSTLAQLYGAVGNMLYDQKQFDQAATVVQKGLALSPQDPNLLATFGEIQVSQGQPAAGIATFQRIIQSKLASGQKADEAVYKRAVSVAYTAKLPVSTELARSWVAAYPSAASWHDAIAVYRNMEQPDVEGTLDLLRLMQATGALTAPQDYVLFAQAASEQSNFNEAQAVLDAGIQGKFVDPSSAQFRETIAALKTKPKATAADLEEALKGSPSAINLIHIGDRFYAMGDYARAAEIDRQALGKPGVDRNLANLHLGMALARAEDRAGATAALKAVSGDLSGVAAYWLLYVQQHA